MKMQRNKRRKTVCFGTDLHVTCLLQRDLERVKTSKIIILCPISYTKVSEAHFFPSNKSVRPQRLPPYEFVDVNNIYLIGNIQNRFSCEQ